MNYTNQILSSYLDLPFIDKNFSHKNHLVFGKKVDIFGNKVLNIQVGSRTMWYCPDIQK